MANQDTANVTNEAVIVATLRHHDQQLGALTTQVVNIQGSLERQSSVLKVISQSLLDMKETQGPGWKEILKVSLQGGALIGLVSAGIGYLVLSAVVPMTTKLESEANNRDKRIEFLLRDRERDYESLQRERWDRLEKNNRMRFMPPSQG